MGLMGEWCDTMYNMFMKCKSEQGAIKEWACNENEWDMNVQRMRKTRRRRWR